MQMSLENVVEKEIVVNIQEEEQEKTGETNNENNTENNVVASEEEVKEENSPKFVEKKSINSLSEDKRAIIIANAKNGVDQPYFNVKFFKNGRTTITKKKEPPQTVSKKVVSQNTAAKIPPKKDLPVYYTDNQLLFEHIIELNAKVDRLMQKHKKLKRRYQTLQDDLYVDDAEEIQSNIPQTEPQKLHPQEVQQEELQQPKVPVRSSRNIKNGWRSQVAFL